MQSIQMRNIVKRKDADKHKKSSITSLIISNLRRRKFLNPPAKAYKRKTNEKIRSFSD